MQRRRVAAAGVFVAVALLVLYARWPVDLVDAHEASEAPVAVRTVVSAPRSARLRRLARAEDAEVDEEADGEPEVEQAWVTVFVVDSDGGPLDDAEIAICSPGFAPSQGGVLERMVRADQDCLLRARIPDGALKRRAEDVVIRLEPGSHEVAELVVDSVRIGGIGVSLGRCMGPHSEICAFRVMPDGPAGRAGLPDATVFAAVDGRSTLGMGLEEFIAEVTGPVGTLTPVLQVRHHAGGEDIRLVRRYINSGVNPKTGRREAWFDEEDDEEYAFEEEPVLSDTGYDTGAR